jgi:hypothetical protein
MGSAFERMLIFGRKEGAEKVGERAREREGGREGERSVHGVSGYCSGAPFWFVGEVRREVCAASPPPPER